MSTAYALSLAGASVVVLEGLRVGGQVTGRSSAKITKKVRTAAEEIKDRHGKAIMNRIADDYERLAQHAKQRRRSHND